MSDTFCLKGRAKARKDNIVFGEVPKFPLKGVSNVARYTRLTGRLKNTFSWKRLTRLLAILLKHVAHREYAFWPTYSR